MVDAYESLPKQIKGAWIVHHGQKTVATVHGAAEFPALDAAGKAAALLSQLATSEQTTIEKARVDALARAAGLNPKTELPALLGMIERRRVIERSESGDVEVLGLTTRATVQHAADVFEDQEPSKEERASIALAEITSAAPTRYAVTLEFVSDEFQIQRTAAADLLARSETVGFLDAEGTGTDKVYFNGNLFRRDRIEKVTRVLESLNPAEQSAAMTLDAHLDANGFVSTQEAERVLGPKLFEKLKAAGMYDVNLVSNSAGEFTFVTKPSAFHKFNDPMADDAFDLAKALVAALAYGMTQSTYGRGKIEMINLLLRKLIRGSPVGPATAIGEDYKVLEMKGVLRVTKAPSFGYNMTLLKKDVGQMALAVLTTGEAASAKVLDRPLPGQMTGYSGPEKTRSELRQKQSAPSKRMTRDVLEALRTGSAL